MTAGVSNPPQPGEGGLPRVVLSSPGGGRAEVYLHGAHVTRWTHPSADEVLYLSPRSRFAPGEAIRGGIPVIFPQFAERGPLPKHGFARTAEWTLDESSTDHAALVLTDAPETRAIWDFAFRAELRVEVGDALATTLTVENTGNRAFEFTCALHGYLRVADVSRVELNGLDGLRFEDRVSGESHYQLGDKLSVRREFDRVYIGAPDELRMREYDHQRTVVIRKRGFSDAVVWNPWAAKAREIEDLGEDAYSRFLCIEPACIHRPVRLEPGALWEGRQEISVENG